MGEPYARCGKSREISSRLKNWPAPRVWPLRFAAFALHGPRPGTHAAQEPNTPPLRGVSTSMQNPRRCFVHVRPTPAGDVHSHQHYINSAPACSPLLRNHCTIREPPSANPAIQPRNPSDMDHQRVPSVSVSVLPNLLWVSDQDGARGKKKARSHAMREWRRVKKGKKAAALRESAVNSARFSSWVRADHSGLPLTPPSSGEDKESTPEEEGHLQRQLVPLVHKIWYECGPLSVLGAGRRNPYLAIDLSQDGDLLFGPL